MSDVCEIAAYRLSPIAEGPSALPSSHSLQLPVSISSYLSTQCQPLYASHWAVLPYFSRHCTLRLKMPYFLCLLFYAYYLCEESYKSITVQYYIANCVRWISWANSVGFNIQIGLTSMLLEWNLFVRWGLTVLTAHSTIPCCQGCSLWLLPLPRPVSLSPLLSLPQSHMHT